MASSSPVVQNRYQTAATSTGAGGGAGYPVDDIGYGLLFGDKHGATPQDIQLEGALRSLTPPSGKQQPWVITTEPGVHMLGSAVVTASQTGPTRFEILGGVSDVIVTAIIVRNATKPMPAGMLGRVYEAPVVTVGGVTDWNDATLLAPEFSLAGLTDPFQIVDQAGLKKMTQPVFFHYRPMGTVGPADSTFTVEVWGRTYWYSNIPKPLPRS
ncbi:hypothetical protein FPV16_19780 [Methylobacterium sp. W2]|uniref:hypothetical protein n=1 Tax=Methylobacterium sp. W2 TaxID=2598107 RepID=UPI001D0C8AE7|nr:hypothetical protein [Methylobacterium sp. W2]MCC0808424.1 hypothetical protein [Methylobacterium sp. W2]